MYALHPALLLQPCTPDKALQVHHLGETIHSSSGTPVLFLDKKWDAGTYQPAVHTPRLFVAVILETKSCRQVHRSVFTYTHAHNSVHLHTCWDKLQSFQPDERLQPQRVTVCRCRGLVYHHTERKPVVSELSHKFLSVRPPHMNLPLCLAAVSMSGLLMCLQTGCTQAPRKLKSVRRSHSRSNI